MLLSPPLFIEGIRSSPILKLTTHPPRSPLRQAEVVHTANPPTNIDRLLGKKCLRHASLPKTPSRKGWSGEGFGVSESIEEGGEDGSGSD
eukprot:scaffold10410_cov144-Isochrysis_galbana.AAC.3